MGMTAKQASEYVSHDWIAQHESKSTTLVFISMSMPPEVLKQLFAQVWANKPLRDSAVFIVRGWPEQPTGLAALVSEIGQLQPTLQHQVNVSVDPLLFSAHHVEQVPVVLHLSPRGHWHTITGEGYGVVDAVRRIDEGKTQPDHAGETWPVLEPNMVTAMESRIKRYNFKAQQARVEQSAWSALPGQAAKLPESPVRLHAFFNPSIVATHDIRLPDGRLMVKAGTVINPLAQNMPWQNLHYAVFNASKPWEVAQAKAWAAQYPSIQLLMTEPPNTQAGFAAVAQAFGAPVFVASPLVVSRIGVTATPALVRVEGLELAIEVPAAPSGMNR
jgi:conjugal transfer pilus assembly protein TraW